MNYFLILLRASMLNSRPVASCEFDMLDLEHSACICIFFKVYFRKERDQFIKLVIFGRVGMFFIFFYGRWTTNHEATLCQEMILAYQYKRGNIKDFFKIAPIH